MKCNKSGRFLSFSFLSPLPVSDTLAAGMHPAIVIRSSYDSVVSWRKVNGPNDFRDSQNGWGVVRENGQNTAAGMKGGGKEKTKRESIDITNNYIDFGCAFIYIYIYLFLSLLLCNNRSEELKVADSRKKNSFFGWETITLKKKKKKKLTRLSVG